MQIAPAYADRQPVTAEEEAYNFCWKASAVAVTATATG